ncbi:hypothetical protein GIB67_000646 [Kingdonia uniflora]|uniref:Protein root UVB sensitive/RUS domain-containing protein n=1 Tax=Kingdonia uniflora TaxID=39325 RepID=A0A7J7NDK8_9MAGN|nr:hypothetical protein GIB67_000646 [Kingdonia uniflora]
MSSSASTTIVNEKKKDEDWEYGEARDPANRNDVWYKLCNKKCTAGISRLKEHLIGGYPSVTKCPNVLVEVSKKFKDMADKVLPEYVHPSEDLIYEQVEAAVLGDDVGPSTRSRTTETRGEQSQPRGVVEGFIDETEPRHRVSRRSTGVQPQPHTYQHRAHLIGEEEDEADDMEINEEDDGNSDDDGLVSGEEEPGMLMDLVSPLFPSAFVLVVCLGSISRSFTGVASGATRAALTQHFSRQNNAADISAKNKFLFLLFCTGRKSRDNGNYDRDGVGNASCSRYSGIPSTYLVFIFVAYRFSYVRDYPILVMCKIDG